MNELMVFNNEEFGTMRVILLDGKPWFVGKDVAKSLGYVNQNRDIETHVDEDDRIYFDAKTQYENGIEFDYKTLGQRGGWIINEPGFYSLVLSSKLPSAKKFKHWVTHDVIPSIMKTGSYTYNKEDINNITSNDNINPITIINKMVDVMQQNTNIIQQLLPVVLQIQNKVVDNVSVTEPLIESPTEEFSDDNFNNEKDEQDTDSATQADDTITDTDSTKEEHEVKIINGQRYTVYHDVEHHDNLEGLDDYIENELDERLGKVYDFDFGKLKETDPNPPETVDIKVERITKVLVYKENWGIRESTKWLGIGEKVFVRWLIENDYLFRNKYKNLEPTDLSLDNQLITIARYYHQGYISVTSKITYKGRLYFRRELIADGLLQPQEDKEKEVA